MKRWKEHFSEVLNRDNPSNPIEVNPDRIIDQNIEIHVDESEIKNIEVKEAIKRLKNGKTPGQDQIQTEMLKADSITSEAELTKLFNKILQKEQVPSSWKKGMIIKIPKKGDIRECKNWRGVTVLPVISKIFGRILINRIKNGVDKVLRKEQAGFREKRSTTEQIFVLRNILEQANEWRAPIYIHFVDFEKAFDSVHREGLWNIMGAYGIPRKLITMVKAMYDGFQCTVVDEGEQTEWFNITSGVKQGCLMSGFLFLLVTDWIMRKTLDHHRTGLRWDFTTVLEDLDFADDIALLASKHEHIQIKTNRLVEEARRTGLKLNAEKCKTMRANARIQEQIKIEDRGVEDVEEFIYLGAKMKMDGGGTEDIQLRLGKARGAFRSLWKIWQDKQIGRKTKGTLFKSLVRPVLLYGSEAWKMSKTEERKLDAFQTKCLRNILGIRWPDKVRNEVILERMNTNRISDEMRRRRWCWIGHIMRKEERNDCMVALEWRPEGSRAVGRPKITWRRTVETERNSMGCNSWREARRKAKDRNKWKGLVTALCDTWR